MLLLYEIQQLFSIHTVPIPVHTSRTRMSPESQRLPTPDSGKRALVELLQFHVAHVVYSEMEVLSSEIKKFQPLRTVRACSDQHGTS